MNYSTEIITPDMAQSYLNTSVGNRPISNKVVQSYADTMTQGKWMLNGALIIFDSEGHLTDGHHRLQAVIKANMPVSFGICRGVPSEAFATYDCGRHRTLGQLIAIRGGKNYNIAASIVTANSTLINRGRLTAHNASGGKNQILTNQDKYELYLKDPKGFDTAAAIATSLWHKCATLSCAWIGGLIYYLTHTGGYTMGEVMPFFDELLSTSTSNIAVVDMARELLIKNRMSKRKYNDEYLWALVVKTWNHYINGTTPKILRYSEGETLPMLKLKT